MGPGYAPLDANTLEALLIIAMVILAVLSVISFARGLCSMAAREMPKPPQRTQAGER